MTADDELALFEIKKSNRKRCDFESRIVFYTV